MATVEETQKILKEIRALKLLFIKAQEYESASIMREMEKRYLEKKVK